MALTDIEQRRFSSYINFDRIGMNGMEVIRSSKVLIVGAGSVGIPAALYLLSSGVGKLGICDFQTITEKTFYKQTIFGTGDLGKLKTIVLKEKLANTHPNAVITIHNIELKKENVGKFVENYDVILNCTNSLESDAMYADFFGDKIVVNAYCKGFSAIVWTGMLSLSEKLLIKNDETAFGANFVVAPMAGITGSTVANIVFKHLSGVETIVPNLQIKL